MAERLHPLKNQDLQWTEEIPIPTVSYDLSLANEPYVVEFDIEKYSRLLSQKEIPSGRISSLKVNLTKEDGGSPNGLANYQPHNNFLEVLTGHMWQRFVDDNHFFDLTEGGFKDSNISKIAIAHETQHLKDRKLIIGSFSTILVTSLATLGSLYIDPPNITNNEILNGAFSMGAWFGVSLATLMRFRAIFEDRAEKAEKQYRQATGILVLKPNKNQTIQ